MMQNLALTNAELRPRNQLRLAVTVPDPNTGEYPARDDCPNTYWIVFVDAAYPAQIDGQQTPSINPRQDLGTPRETAYNLIDGQEGYAPPYTLVEVSWHNRQWWFQYVETTPCGSSSSSSGSSSGYSSSGSESFGSELSDSGSGSGSGSTSASGSGSGSGSGSTSASGSAGSGSGGEPGSESFASGSAGSGGGSDGGSDKSSAIVPASWSPGGYTALFIAECPDVRFDDVMVVAVPQKGTRIRVDPKFLEVCEPGSVQVCGCVPDLPVLVGAKVEDGCVRLRFAERRPRQNVQLTIRLTGVRKGFRGLRFPDRSRAEFEANERFLKMAKP